MYKTEPEVFFHFFFIVRSASEQRQGKKKRELKKYKRIEEAYIGTPKNLIYMHASGRESLRDTPRCIYRAPHNPARGVWQLCSNIARLLLFSEGFPPTVCWNWERGGGALPVDIFSTPPKDISHTQSFIIIIINSSRFLPPDSLATKR